MPDDPKPTIYDACDLDSERAARAMWSYLAEPDDDEAHALVAHLGPRQALTQVRAGHGNHQWHSRLTEPEINGVDLRSNLATAVTKSPPTSDRLLIPGDDEWPAGLNSLGPRAPFCLWVRGPLNLATATTRSVALTGSRASTAYGERVARELASGCAEQSVTVISGGAFGIDAAAHRGTLANNGRTIAVLASGLDRPHPHGNADLLQQIAQVGALISELPPGSAPARRRFLARNRLIAAITGATVSVEATRRSGTLNMAAEAARLGKPLAAVPGPVTSTASEGCHQLLRKGAICVTSVGEVIELITP